MLADKALLFSKGRSGVHPDKKPELYKTEMCRNWTEMGSCRYGKKCRFAHGPDEVRSIERHVRYKTEICRTYHLTGTCLYGVRCTFIHDESRGDTQFDDTTASSTSSEGSDTGQVDLLADHFDDKDAVKDLLFSPNGSMFMERHSATFIGAPDLHCPDYKSSQTRIANSSAPGQVTTHAKKDKRLAAFSSICSDQHESKSRTFHQWSPFAQVGNSTFPLPEIRTFHISPFHPTSTMHAKNLAW